MGGTRPHCALAEMEQRFGYGLEEVERRFGGSSVRWCVAWRRYMRLDRAGLCLTKFNKGDGGREVSMELAVAVRLAALEGLAAVEKCSGLSGRGLSDLAHRNRGPKKTWCILICPGRPIMKIPVGRLAAYAG